VVGSNGGAEAPTVIDVSERDFDTEVIERSKQMPVVVDFWAPWCGPCRMLGPTLEKLAREGGGAWVLAKLNTDDNPRLSQQFGIQGIPAVKAFRDGKVVDEFVGAQPEPVVRQFVSRLAPSRAETLAKEARSAELTGDLAAASRLYEEALAGQPDNAAALLGLGRLRLSEDRLDDAIALLGRVPHGGPLRQEAEALLARARFRSQAGVTEDEMEVRHRVAADPGDFDARLALASVMADKGAHREALEALLSVLEESSGDTRERARADMLSLFQMLGDGNGLTREYRPRLATLLF
jgi:putative thioredoxin